MRMKEKIKVNKKEEEDNKCTKGDILSEKEKCHFCFIREIINMSNI